MNAFTKIEDLVMPLPLETRGYTVAPSKQSPRLLELTFARETVDAFVKAVAEWPVTAHQNYVGENYGLGGRNAKVAGVELFRRESAEEAESRAREHERIASQLP